ncbi:hypothetical protein ACHAQJ_009702 [Trichoderma viride]
MPQSHEGSATEGQAIRRKPISAKRQRQNRESQRTFREKQKKLRALRRVTTRVNSVAQNASKVNSAPQSRFSQEDNILVDTTAPPLPDILQTLVCQDESASLLAPSSPSSGRRCQSEHPLESGGTISPALFTLEPPSIAFQHMSDRTDDHMTQWEAGLENNFDVSMPIDYAGAFSTLNSSTVGYNNNSNKSEVWPFLTTQTSRLPSVEPFSMSTPELFSQEGTNIVASATASLGKKQGSIDGSHDSILRLMASRYVTTSEPRPPTSEAAENISRNTLRQRRMSADHTGALDALQLLHISQNEENKGLLKRALAQDHSMGEIFLAGLRVLGGSPQHTQFNAIPALPDVYTNHLSLRHMNIFRAFFSNAVALHFPVEKLIGSNSLSPFYRQEANTTEALQNIMDIMPNTLPQDLKPTPPQITYGHSPFLDLLPFPTLRARAIIFSACTPPIVDLVELKNDIIDGGLVCWLTSQKGSGQLWDKRSWEATPWFIDKWKVLVGDTNDEIWSQTKWWKQLKEGQSVVTS